MAWTFTIRCNTTSNKTNNRAGMHNLGSSSSSSSSPLPFMASLRAALNNFAAAAAGGNEAQQRRRKLLHRRSKSMPTQPRSSSSSSSSLSFCSWLSFKGPSVAAANADAGAAVVEFEHVIAAANTASYFSGEWLQAALEGAVCSLRQATADIETQREMTALSASASEAVELSEWASRHMDDLVLMLDICNALRERLSLLAACAGKARLGSAPAESSDLWRHLGRDPAMEKCAAALRRMEDRCAAEHRGRRTCLQLGVPPLAMRAKAATGFCCGVMLAALSLGSSSPAPCLVFGKRNPWIGAEVYGKVKDEALLRARGAADGGGRGPLLAELRNLGLALRSPAALAMAASQAEASLSALDSKVSELYRHIISQRVALLNAISYSYL